MRISKSTVLNRFRFQIDNGVTHPKFGNGIVSYHTRDGYAVEFDHGTEIVKDGDLISNPKGGKYRKSNRQIYQDARYAEAQKQKKAK